MKKMMYTKDLEGIKTENWLVYLQDTVDKAKKKYRSKEYQLEECKRVLKISYPETFERIYL